MILNVKEMKQATKSGGEIGPLIRHTNSGGSLAYAISEELPFSRFGQTINLIAEYRNHIGFMIQISTMKYQWLLIPKQEIVEWGILKRWDIPSMETDRSNMIAGLLLYGPIGAIVGGAMDSAAAQKQSEKPVIGITWRTDDSDHAIFLDFPLVRWYHNLNDFLLKCIPEHHQE